MPGDNGYVDVILLHSIVLDKDVTFVIREGGYTVGIGRITEVLSNYIDKDFKKNLVITSQQKNRTNKKSVRTTLKKYQLRMLNLKKTLIKFNKY